MDRLGSWLRLDGIRKPVEHKLIGAGAGEGYRAAAAVGLHVLQNLALVAVIATAYFSAKPLNALLWIFLLCCLVNVRVAIEDITKNIVFIVLCLQYSLLHLVKINFLDDLIPGVTGGVLQSRMWLWGGIVVLLSVPFFCGIKDLPRLVDGVIPPILLLTFAALSFLYLKGAVSGGGWESGGCRTKGLHYAVFDAPLIFTTLTVVYLRNIDVKSIAARRVACALVAGSLVMSIAIAGTRSIAVAQIVTYSVCCLIFALTSSAGRRLALQLFASVVLGAFIGLVLIYFVDCAANSLVRIVKPSTDVSVLTRYELYMKSLKLIAERPIKGYGIAFEASVAEPYRYVHNQYLSWALWGGVISLASGMIFMSASVWSNWAQMRQPRALILVVSVLGPWGLSNLFDSFLMRSGRFYLFIIYLCLVQVLLVREAGSRS